jgi:hypothetical protein
MNTNYRNLTNIQTTLANDRQVVKWLYCIVELDTGRSLHIVCGWICSNSTWRKKLLVHGVSSEILSPRGGVVSLWRSGPNLLTRAHSQPHWEVIWTEDGDEIDYFVLML